MPEKYRGSRQQYLTDFFHESRAAHAAERDALLIVRNFNARLSTTKSAGFWPTIATVLKANHPWVRILCESCELIAELDLRMKPRDPDASVRVVLKDARCPRCNGHGRPRIIGLERLPSR